MKLKGKSIKLLIFISLSIMVIKCSSGEKLNIYLIGDSTVAEYDSTRYPLTGWGMKLRLFFDDNVIIHNMAKGGASTKRYIYYGRWKTVLDSLKKGDYLIIQFGHNDQKTDTLRHTNPGGSFNKNLEKFVTEARTKGAIPILVTPVRRRLYDEDGHLLNTHGKYPDAVRDVAKELNVPLIDLQKLTKSLYEKYGIEKSKQLFLWVEPGKYPAYPDGKQDNTHFSELGAFEICKLVISELKKMPFELKKHIITPAEMNVKG